MLDALWNIDKHRVIHIVEVDLTLEGLTAERRRDGKALKFDLASWGPRLINLSNFNDETQLGLIKMREAWPSSPDDVDVKRKIRVNVRLDYGPPASV